ncbi:DMT family transporter [Cognatiluteimonas lumbrici]|uniref:hypothetical protein n=1 Tax=Cognatiluteimonas lumbrici TaxID=2559601 RepID=UPI0011299AC6|nr:hypothetical protein [Luteimonas lumbrici]
MSPKPTIALVIAGLSFATGAIAQYYWPGASQSPIDWFHVISGAVLLFAWYRIDSKQRGYKTSPWLDAGVFAIAIVGLTYYFFRSRGAKSGAIATLLFLAAMLAAGMLTLAGQYATYYAVQV